MYIYIVKMLFYYLSPTVFLCVFNYGIIEGLKRCVLFCLSTEFCCMYDNNTYIRCVVCKVIFQSFLKSKIWQQVVPTG